MFDFLKNIGPSEFILIGILVVVFFGSKIAIKLAKTGGETVKELKKVKNEIANPLK
jgi:Sec-independent protein translocase protein TatA